MFQNKILKNNLKFKINKNKIMGNFLNSDSKQHSQYKNMNPKEMQCGVCKKRCGDIMIAMTLTDGLAVATKCPCGHNIGKHNII